MLKKILYKNLALKNTNIGRNTMTFNSNSFFMSVKRDLLRSWSSLIAATLACYTNLSVVK